MNDVATLRPYVFGFVQKISDERVRVRMTRQAEGMRFIVKVRVSELPPKTLSKSKAVPLHAMEAYGRRGGIAPTHS
jgi:hypothetical protein